MGVTEMLVIC